MTITKNLNIAEANLKYGRITHEHYLSILQDAIDNGDILLPQNTDVFARAILLVAAGDLKMDGGFVDRVHARKAELESEMQQVLRSNTIVESKEKPALSPKLASTPSASDGDETKPFSWFIGLLAFDVFTFAWRSALIGGLMGLFIPHVFPFWLFIERIRIIEIGVGALALSLLLLVAKRITGPLKKSDTIPDFLFNLAAIIVLLSALTQVKNLHGL